MKYFVSVRAGSSQEKVEQTDEHHLKVWVREVAEKGKANRAVEKVIAEHFQKPKSQVIIVAGQSSKEKIIEVI